MTTLRGTLKIYKAKLYFLFLSLMIIGISKSHLVVTELPLISNDRHLVHLKSGCIVSNFGESGDRSKNSNFFYLPQKTLLVNYFQK